MDLRPFLHRWKERFEKAKAGVRKHPRKALAAAVSLAITVVLLCIKDRKEIAAPIRHMWDTDKTAEVVPVIRAANQLSPTELQEVLGGIFDREIQERKPIYRPPTGDTYAGYPEIAGQNVKVILNTLLPALKDVSPWSDELKPLLEKLQTWPQIGDTNATTIEKYLAELEKINQEVSKFLAQQQSKQARKAMQKNEDLTTWIHIARVTQAQEDITDPAQRAQIQAAWAPLATKNYVTPLLSKLDEYGLEIRNPQILMQLVDTAYHRGLNGAVQILISVVQALQNWDLITDDPHTPFSVKTDPKGAVSLGGVKYTLDANPTPVKYKLSELNVWIAKHPELIQNMIALAREQYEVRKYWVRAGFWPGLKQRFASHLKTEGRQDACAQAEQLDDAISADQLEFADVSLTQLRELIASASLGGQAKLARDGKCICYRVQFKPGEVTENFNKIASASRPPKNSTFVHGTASGNTHQDDPSQVVYVPENGGWKPISYVQQDFSALNTLLWSGEAGCLVTTAGMIIQLMPLEQGIGAVNGKICRALRDDRMPQPNIGKATAWAEPPTQSAACINHAGNAIEIVLPGILDAHGKAQGVPAPNMQQLLATRALIGYLRTQGRLIVATSKDPNTYPARSEVEIVFGAELRNYFPVPVGSAEGIYHWELNPGALPTANHAAISRIRFAEQAYVHQDAHSDDFDWRTRQFLGILSAPEARINILRTFVGAVAAEWLIPLPPSLNDQTPLQKLRPATSISPRPNPGASNNTHTPTWLLASRQVSPKKVEKKK